MAQQPQYSPYYLERNQRGPPSAECWSLCGRVPPLDPHLAEMYWNGSVQLPPCQACPWGSRVDSSGWCRPCDHPIDGYDWLYLLFMALIPLLAHNIFINLYATRGRRRRKRRGGGGREADRTVGAAAWPSHVCSVLECGLSAAAAVLIAHPAGEWTVRGCRKVGTVGEWYPSLLLSGKGGGGGGGGWRGGSPATVNCSYELVYPLFSLPLIYLLCLLVCMLILRCTLYATVTRRERRRRSRASSPYQDGVDPCAAAIYAALHTIPIVAAVHTVMAGLLFHVFPLVSLVWSVAGTAVHLAGEGRRGGRELLLLVARSPRHMCMLCVNMSTLAFAMVAIQWDRDSSLSLWFVFLTPLPALFYVATIPFSHPLSLERVG